MQAWLGSKFRTQHAVQAQGHVGVLRGIAGGIVQRDLREQDLLGALARDFLVLDRVVAQVAFGQAVHVVAAAAGVQHETFEHGVVGIARHLDPMATQHVQIVFAVLAELPAIRIGEQRRQRSQCRRAIQLRRRTRIFMRKRQVDGLAGFDRKTHADQIRLHRVEAVGLGVEGEFSGFFQHADQRVELRVGDHRCVFARRGQGGIQGHRFGGWGSDETIATGPARLLLRDSSRAGAIQILQCLVEAVTLVKLAQRIHVAFAHAQGLRLALQGNVDLYRHQLAVQRQAIERCTQVVADLALDVVRARDHAIQ